MTERKDITEEVEKNLRKRAEFITDSLLRLEDNPAHTEYVVDLVLKDFRSAFTSGYEKGRTDTLYESAQQVLNETTGRAVHFDDNQPALKSDVHRLQSQINAHAIKIAALKQAFILPDKNWTKKDGK